MIYIIKNCVISNYVVKEGLSAKLTEYLKKTGDPRETGGKIVWDTVRYYATKDFKPRPDREAMELLHLKEEYNYFPEKYLDIQSLVDIKD